MISIDLETSSDVDLKKVGHHAYAEHPSTRIIIMSVHDGEIQSTWDCHDVVGVSSVNAWTMLMDGMHSCDLFAAFNAPFEDAILRHRLLPDLGLRYDVQPKQWRDTALLARAACIPGSLFAAADFLNCEQQKDKIGSALIRMFSLNYVETLLTSGSGEKVKVAVIDPIKYASYTVNLDSKKVTVATAWRMFVEYCAQDVLTEMEVAEKLRPLADETLQKGWEFDLRMNSRGAPINVDALEHARVLVAEFEVDLVAEFEEIVGCKPTQRALVLHWLNEQGYTAKDLQAKTVAECPDKLTSAGRKALTIYSQLSYVAVKKVERMHEMISTDNRLRSQFVFHGAKTGRWTSRGVQLQNAKRPDIDDADEAYESICVGLDPDLFQIIHGGAYKVVSSVVRNFIQDPRGEILDVDYSNIEGRVAAWLARQENKLQLYREGADLYKELASAVFDVPVDEVDKEQRFVGKVGDLSLQFGSGWRKFHQTCADWGMPIEVSLAKQTVQTYRDVYAETKTAWNDCQNAAVEAIRNPGRWVDANEHISFGYTRKAPFCRLALRLPSGRKLYYPMPTLHPQTMWHKVVRDDDGEIVEDEWIKVKGHVEYDDGRDFFHTQAIKFFGQVRPSKRWGRADTYGADLFQAATQSTAFDIMLAGCLEAQSRGFDIFAVIHDQALAHGGDPDLFVKALCTHPKWLPDDFPLAAEGGLAPYYSK